MEDRKGRLELSLCVCCILSVCVTSGISGVAGEIKDGIVLTDLHKTVQRGNDVVLNCEFYKEPVAVYWKKGDDPEGGVNVVTWVDGREFSGYCMNNERCGIGTTNYSLIIRDAQIADRGRYICRVSNYLGILIHNVTDLKIYARPDEPYPIINECETNGGSSSATRTGDCRISTNSTVMNITCSASGFFPDVNLFFLHGSSKVINIGSNGWKNEDGSKSRSITINARVSDKQYVCVASDIPGSTEEKTAGVYIESYFSSPKKSDNASRSFEKTTANPNEAEMRSGTNPAKIVVPILMILFVATASVVFLWRRSRKRLARSHIGKRDVEESELLMQKVKVQGVVSFYELWLLAYDTPNDEMAKVYTALVKLGIKNVKGQMDKGLVYDALCKWKERSYARDQPQMLRDALEEVGLETRWQEIYDHVRQGNDVTKVPEGTLEQILLDLKGKSSIKKFLNNLLQRESKGLQNEIIVVAHGSEEDKGKSASEEGNIAMENTASVKEISDTNDGEGNNKVSVPVKEVSDTHDVEGNKGNTVSTEETIDGKGNKEDSALTKETEDTRDSKGDNEDSAPAKDTHDGERNKGNSASAKETNNGKGSKEDSALTKETNNTHDSKGDNEDSAPAKETKNTNSGKGSTGNSASAKETNNGKGDNGNSAPTKETNNPHGGKGNKEDSALAPKNNDNHDGKGNTEATAPAKKNDDTHDGKWSKKDSHPANVSKQEEVFQAIEGVEYSDGMHKLKEWNNGPFKQNPFVLVSLALERAGYLHISKTFFDGPVSFYELRSLMYNVNTPSLEKLRKTICKLDMLEVDATSADKFGPQQIYDSLCQWKEGHPQVDQGKILHDALLRARHEEAWWKILEQRKDKSSVCESMFKRILRDIEDPAMIQQLLQKLAPDLAKDVGTSLETDFMEIALKALKECNESSHNENRMILLSRALEKAKCKPIDRTFLSETMSFFELWSVGHFDFDAGVKTLPLRDALKAMGIFGIEETISQHELYHLLCKWKEEHSNCDQRLVFKVHLLNEGLYKEWENLSDLMFGTDRIISNDTLEHILWHLKTPGKINHFLHKLTNTDQEPIPEDSNLPEGIGIALTRLELWKKGPIDKHPVILLSEALESAKCSHVAMTFFQIPVYLQKTIGDEEVSEFIRRLTSRHRKRLANQTPATEDNKISNFAEENNDMLFDAKSMVRDWIEREQCCNYEKRCNLDDMLIEIGRHDMTGKYPITNIVIDVSYMYLCHLNSLFLNEKDYHFI
ncbi:uncharacterized protein LOC135154838 [Lytechinus pictus]|uniref:uncharacterized protein LOC135154838 n=1 Tax=Lytechinus pictus TaxID=7653 RepID=UPI0030B9E7C4